MSYARAWTLIVMLAATAALARPVQSDAIEPAAITALPYSLGGWQGIDDPPGDVAQLGADAYVTRMYSNGQEPPLGLYIAYYAAQRPGVSIHSPLHCLPGTGWEPLEVGTSAITRPDGTPGNVRRLLVRKNLDRAVVFYWYQLHGRMIASELKSKAYLLADSLRLRRGDAALVRIVVPVSDRVDDAADRGLAFVRDLMPRLMPLL
jgi:EpsI family protein